MAKLIQLWSPVAVAVCYIGCSDGVTVTELPPTQQQLQYIGMAYQQAVTELGRAPANMDEFRKFLASYGEPEALLENPQGSGAIQVVWNVDTQNVRRGSMPIVAFASAADGTHTGVDLQLAILQLSDEQVAQLTP